MEWNIRADRPVYLQLIEQLELAIISGECPPGSKVPPVRELSADAGVNPNTMQRALQELEARGLMQTQRTAGRSITTDEALLLTARTARAAALTKSFLQQMRALGVTAAEARALLQEAAQAPEKEG